MFSPTPQQAPPPRKVPPAVLAQSCRSWDEFVAAGTALGYTGPDLWPHMGRWRTAVDHAVTAFRKPPTPLKRVLKLKCT